jgi:hypothetical protein
MFLGRAVILLIWKTNPLRQIKANNSSIVEYFDIDSIGNKIPDQIFATVETGDWVSSLQIMFSYPLVIIPLIKL